MIKSDMYLLNEQHNVVGIVTGYKEAPNRFIVRTTRGETLVYNTRSESWEGEVSYPLPYSGNFIGNASGEVESSSEAETSSGDESSECCECCAGCDCEEPILEISHGDYFASKAGPVLVVANPHAATFSTKPWIGFYWTAVSDTLTDLEDVKSYVVKELDSDGRYYDADEDDVYDGIFDLIEFIGPSSEVDILDAELVNEDIISALEE
jgi:hypothetical protein